jgi:hypothetical protein
MAIAKLKMAVVSENYRNDGEPIADLLTRYFPDKISIIQFCKRFKGDKLQTADFFLELEASCKAEKPDIVLIVRDLDSDKKQKLRNEYFEQCKANITEIQSVFLLFVYEIEALALADLKTVETFYYLKKPIIFTKTPEKQTNPKDFLQKNTNYSESDMRELVALFDLNQLKNYTVWADFIENMQTQISNIR